MLQIWHVYGSQSGPIPNCDARTGLLASVTTTGSLRLVSMLLFCNVQSDQFVFIRRPCQNGEKPRDWPPATDGVARSLNAMVTGGNVLKPSAVDSVDLQAVIDPLSMLPRSHAELPDYYRKLADSNDETLRVGALCALIDMGRIPRDLTDQIIALSSYGAVRSRAFDHFLDSRDLHKARAVLAVPFDPADTFVESTMSLRLMDDSAGLMALEARQFLRDGQLEHLRRAAEHAENVGGWTVALPWAMRYLTLAPTDGGGAFHLLLLLRDANQYGLMKQAHSAFEAANLFPTTRSIFAAALHLANGEAGAALAILATIRERAPLKEVQAFIEGLRAQASEALGNYQEAYRQYVGMNQINRAPDIDPEWLIQSVASTEARDIGPLPPDPHTDDFMMLGFPRSGTTLLENALQHTRKSKPSRKYRPSIQSWPSSIRRIQARILRLLALPPVACTTNALRKIASSMTPASLSTKCRYVPFMQICSKSCFPKSAIFSRSATLATSC